MVVTVAIYALQILTGGWLTNLLAFQPAASILEPWRFITAGFVHSDSLFSNPLSVLHIVLNMYTLFLFGRTLEPIIGRWRFLALYLISIVGGSIAVMWLASPIQVVVGASGGAFGLMAAFLIILRSIGANTTTMAGVIAINLVFTFMNPSISWEAHVGGLALGAATLANIMFDETAIRPNGLWRSLGALSLVAATVGMVPAITGVVDGRWGQPETTLSQLLTQLPTNPESGDYNVVFVGRSEVLPMAGKAINDAVAFAVSDDGELTLRDHWMPISSSLDESVSSAFSAVIADQTVRAGRLLAPLAIRYIVVPIVDGGASTVERPLPAPDGLLASLSAQLDFRRVYTANDLVIFENVAYIPSLAVIDENTSLVSEQAGSEVLLSSQLASVAPLARSGDVESVPSQIGVGTVHAAVPFDDGLALDIQGVKVKARVAFGGTSAFDLPIEGVARLTFDTPLLHFVLVAFQALLWAVVVIALFDLGRFKRRIASTRLGEIVFHEETEDQK